MVISPPISNLFQCITTFILKIFFPCLDWISCAATSVYCLLSLCCALLRGLWLHLPSFLSTGCPKTAAESPLHPPEVFPKLDKTSSPSVFSYITYSSSPGILVVLHWIHSSLSMQKNKNHKILSCFILHISNISNISVLVRISLTSKNSTCYTSQKSLIFSWHSLKNIWLASL